MLTSAARRDSLPGRAGIDVLEVDRLPRALPETAPDVVVSPDAILGLVHTSGSTGAAKAIAIGHQDAAELLASFDEERAPRAAGAVRRALVMVGDERA